MDRVIYDRMAELADQHWWYVARRQILAQLIEREIKPRAGARILEVGCGTGHNLAMLGQFGEVDALELDDEARAIAEAKLGKPVMSAPLPDLVGVPEGHYDLIAALDVIEHIDDDRAALRGLARLLKPGGRLLMTVPAHQWMWSAHDVANHHHRRYSHAALKQLVAGSPFKLDESGYFNSLLFPLAVGARMASKLRGHEDSDDKLPPSPVNAAFRSIFGWERYLVGRVPLPPGLSLFAVASLDNPNRP